MTQSPLPRSPLSSVISSIGVSFLIPIAFCQMQAPPSPGFVLFVSHDCPPTSAHVSTGSRMLLSPFVSSMHRLLLALLKTYSSPVQLVPPHAAAAHRSLEVLALQPSRT